LVPLIIFGLWGGALADTFDRRKILVDSRVVEAGIVVIGSGVRASKLAIDGAVLATLPNAEVLDLALPTE
ncbi:MAG TPA: hypothetical protein GXZ30_03290, partial [Propionibacterium sp.]|nr:hypothetical protein [Propionibacterium sp.]